MKVEIREKTRKMAENNLFREYIGITLGILITAVGLDFFLVPNRLAAGGVSGLSTVLHYTAGVPVGATMLAMNAILLLVGARVYGKRYGFKTIYGAVGLALAVDLLAGAMVLARVSTVASPILGLLYGGTLTGVGMGIVFKNGGNTGGTDVIAQILAKYTDFGVGQLFLLVDGFVMLVAASVFGIRLALFGFMAVFIMGWVIDTIQEGIGINRAAFISHIKEERSIGRIEALVGSKH